MKKQVMNTFLIGLLIALTLQPFQVNAQKINKESEKVNYIKLPYHRLPSEVKTYAAGIISQSNYGNNFNTEEMQKKLQTLNGYEVAEVSEADLLITLEMEGGLTFSDIKAFEGTKIYYPVTRVIGGRGTRYNYMYYKYKIDLPKATLTITDTKGKMKPVVRELGSKAVSAYFGNDVTIDNRYRTVSSLETAWQKQKNEVLAGNERERFERMLIQANRILKEYCLQKADFSLQIAFIQPSGKNTHDYTDFNEASKKLKRAIKAISSDYIGTAGKLIQPKYEESRKDLYEAIATWEKMLEESNPEDKNARVNKNVTREVYFHLAKAYFWADDYAKAKENFQSRVLDFDKTIDVGEGIDNFKRLIDEQERRYLRNAWRDIYINDGEVVSSESKSKIREKVEEMKSESTEVDKSQFAIIHFYMPKAFSGSAVYGVFMNDEKIDEDIAGGQRIDYKMYSTGGLVLTTQKLLDDGEESDEANNIKELIIDIRSGEEYYVKIGSGGGLKLMTETDGKKDANKLNVLPDELEEDIKNPIPNLSISFMTDY